jgi:hypothetical protein
MHKDMILLILLAGLMMLTGCTKKYPVLSDQTLVSSSSTCVTCHTDEGMLKKVASPLPPDTAGSGEG